MLFVSSCVSSQDRIEAAGKKKGEASVVDKAIKTADEARSIARKRQRLPVTCGEKIKVKDIPGSTEASLALRYAAGLGKANQRIVNCYRTDGILAGINVPVPTARQSQ